MRRGQDIAVRFPGLYLVHHNLPGKRVDWHEWPQHLLFIPLQGEIRVRVRSGLLIGGPGRMIYVPPMTPLVFQSSESLGERLVCLIDRQRWRGTTSLRFAPTIAPAHQLCKEVLFYLLLNPTTKAARVLITTFVQVLAESLGSAQHSPLLNVQHLDSKVRDERVRRAVAILARDHAREVRMRFVAQEAGLSLRNLNRLFLEQVGLAPKQALAQYRIAAAKDQLLKGSTVAEAAFASGYKSLAQFITVFRRLTGQLPSEVARVGSKQ